MSATPRPTLGWNLDHSYARLPTVLFDACAAARFEAPGLVIANHALACELGLDMSLASDDELAAIFSGQSLPDGAAPIAQAYAGHQYGHFTMLGDGRAMLVGEQITPSGARFDIQLKGSGETAYSRRGDGRAALGPMLREYIISEAMHALGIPTTRSLAVVATGETVARGAGKPGAVLARVAASHIRVGTFQFAAGLEEIEVLRALADHAIARHDAQLADSPARYAGFLRAVIARQAALVARWQCVGFVHGVLNTDNTAVSGETIDYGPCAFMDAYNPDTVFSSIDHHGRYRYAHQPAIIQWNLARFAEAMVPLLSDDEPTAIARANEALDAFAPLYRAAWLAGMRAKLGLVREEAEDLALAQDLLAAMHAARADFTNTFRALSEERAVDGLEPWTLRWHARLAREERPRSKALTAMRAVNPAVIPRNHRVEEALSAAEERGELAPFHELLAAVSSPFALSASRAHLAEPPPRDFAECYRTFCGT
ncbi:MAG: YdiU family protein [Phycisphaera sp.]|nr:YdiU family protein [Phycisphaera sp.]